jgi:hypothetical protein
MPRGTHTRPGPARPSRRGSVSLPSTRASCTGGRRGRRSRSECGTPFFHPPPARSESRVAISRVARSSFARSFVRAPLLRLRCAAAPRCDRRVALSRLLARAGGENSWITLENNKTTADAMRDVWRGLEVVEAASRVGLDMLVRGVCEREGFWGGFPSLDPSVGVESTGSTPCLYYNLPG